MFQSEQRKLALKIAGDAMMLNLFCDKHNVKPGKTLEMLMKKYSISAEQIAELKSEHFSGIRL